MSENDAEEQVIVAIDAVVRASGEAKADQLSRAKELLVYKLPHKMPQYFPLLLEFQTEPGALMKQRVISVVMECVEAFPQFEYLSAATGCIRSMLNDAFPSVVKAALVGTRTLFALSLHALCYAPLAEREQGSSHWHALLGVLNTITGPLLTNHRNQGVRMLTYKLLEQVALMTSASHCPGMQGRFRTKPFTTSVCLSLKDLEQASLQCRTALAALAKPGSLKSMPTCCQIVLLMVHTGLALKRPVFAKESVTVLLRATNSLRDVVDKCVSGVAGAVKPAVASLRKACVDSLLTLLRADDPALMQHEDQLLRCLEILKADAQATIAVQRRNSHIVRAQRAGERAQEFTDEPPLSRPRTQPPDGVPEDVAGKVAEVATSVPQLFCKSGLMAVMDLVGRLDSSLLVALVLSRMKFLPEAPPPEHSTLDTCLAEQQIKCAQRLGIRLEQAGATQHSDANDAGRAGAVPAVPRPAADAASAAAPPPGVAAAQVPGPTDPRAQQPPAVAAAAPAATLALPSWLTSTPAPAPAPAAPPPRRIKASCPSEADCETLKAAAVHRILQAPATLFPLQRLRVVARLAPAANSPEGQELLIGFKALLKTELESALELAISWLYCLFVKQCHRVLTFESGTGDLPSVLSLSEDKQADSAEAASAYLSGLESVLSTLLDTVHVDERMPKTKLPPVTTLITEVPLLPEGIVKKRLEWLCSLSSKWGKVALLTMRELIKSKHTLKPVMLQLAIRQLLLMHDAELKSGTMRMLANQVYPVLLRHEATALEDAAVKLIADFADQKPGPPAEDDPEGLEAYRAEMQRGASDACELFTVLCTKRPSLLKRFCEVYAEENQDADIKNAIMDSVVSIGKILPPDSRAVLSLIEQGSPELGALLLGFLDGILQQTAGVPPQPVVEAGMMLFQRSEDLQLLSKLIPGMTAAQALEHVGLLVQLPPDRFRAAVQRTVTQPSGGPGVLKPGQLLVHLHVLNNEKVGVSLKQLGVAVSECIKMREIFTQEVVSSVLSQLVNREPLPTLIMRTLINVWTAHADVQRFLINEIAQRLVSRRIYEDSRGVIWTGFIVFAAFAMDCASIGPVCEMLLRLPPDRLAGLLDDKRLQDKRAREKIQDYLSRQPERTLNMDEALLQAIRVRS